MNNQPSRAGGVGVGESESEREHIKDSLFEIFDTAQLRLLVELAKQVKERTGYGEIRLIMVDRRWDKIHADHGFDFRRDHIS